MRFFSTVRWIGFIEGVSFLLLLIFAMPLKYLFQIPIWVTIIGSAHGALWVGYLIILAWASFRFRWPLSVLIWGTIASILPLGPFMFDRYYLAAKNLQQNLPRKDNEPKLSK
ncbi:MAG: DUF3817 domain-containing protein [Zavarzinella sp.]